MIQMSAAEFDQVVEEALALLPDEFRPHLDNVLIEVQAMPDPALLEEFEAPDDLLGLYVGVPLEDKALAPAVMPDRVLIFRDNLCDMCESREELIDEVRITVLHEIGHHFGMDEERLAELGFD